VRIEFTFEFFRIFFWRVCWLKIRLRLIRFLMGFLDSLIFSNPTDFSSSSTIKERSIIRGLLLTKIYCLNLPSVFVWENWSFCKFVTEILSIRSSSYYYCHWSCCGCYWRRNAQDFHSQNLVLNQCWILWVLD